MKTTRILTIVSIIVASTLSSCVKKVDCICKCDKPGKPEVKTLNLRPGPAEGQDVLVTRRDGLPQYEVGNMIGNPDIAASEWTYGAEGGGEGTVRSYLKFTGLSAIPRNATITSAKLSLYGFVPNGSQANPQGNFGDNKTWLKRVLGNWDKTTITWNNKPATTDSARVEIPASTSQWNFNVTDIDVTALVKTMISNNQNYGFCFQLQNEVTYRSIGFSGSRATDSTRRPLLVVSYEQ